MEVIPEVVKAVQLLKEQLDNYSCPECETQCVADDVDIGWVRCPLVKNNYVCLGSCIDLATEARAIELDDPSWSPLSSFAKRIHLSTVQAKVICLKHQAQILRKQMIRQEPVEAPPLELITLLQRIDKLIQRYRSF